MSGSMSFLTPVLRSFLIHSSVTPDSLLHRSGNNSLRLLTVASTILLPATLFLGPGCIEIVPNPFVDDQDAEPEASTDAPTDSTPDRPADSEPDSIDGDRPDADPTLGSPCLDDSQCDDSIECTFDECDLTFSRCRHTPNHLQCQDGRYCNGVELCQPGVGCVSGDPITCSDNDPCTIDRCVEETLSCVHELRDADGDGDPDWHCGGGDCNDLNPLINSFAAEICANGIDDNCNGEIDEEDCVQPSHDTCSDPLEIPFDKTTTASLFGSKRDYAASCIYSFLTRDIVAYVTVPEADIYDLDVLVQGDSGSVYTAALTECGNPATELACARGSYGPTGPIARFIARKVPAGLIPIYVASDTEQTVKIRASLSPAQPAPENETCGTAAELTPGLPYVASLVSISQDLSSACYTAVGELVYRFTTLEAHDIYVYGGSIDGLGNPVLGLRREECVAANTEIACKSGTFPVTFARNQPPGVYYVTVGATAPTSVQFRVELEPPTGRPAGDTCEDAPPIQPNVTVAVPLLGHMYDLVGSCFQTYPDATRTLTLSKPTDVLIMGNYSSGDDGAVSLWRPECTPSSMLGCASGYPSPVRVAIPNVQPGEYRVAIHSRYGNPTKLTAFTRPATPPTLVAFADTCAEAQVIPITGGMFQGNTSNAFAQYAAGCDQAGGTPFGAPDQMLRLDLPSAKRVIFDMRGSNYRTLLNVRKGPGCPGTEMVGACTVGYYTQRSFLDLKLSAGTYFVQVDGFFGESGNWFLDVYVVD